MLIYIILWHFYRWDPPYLFILNIGYPHTDKLNWCWHILPMPYMQVMNEWMLVMGRCFLKHWMMLSVILLKDKRSIFDWTMPHWSGHAYTIWPLGMLISNCSHSLSLSFFCQHYAYHLWLEAGTLTKSGCWSPGHDNLCCMSLRFSLSHFPVCLSPITINKGKKAKAGLKLWTRSKTAPKQTLTSKRALLDGQTPVSGPRFLWCGL